jgi:glycosyltransferase involved in cell wall biosynthesis
MKVLYVIPTYETAWAFGGGTIKAVSQLCRGLVKQGLDVTVYTTDADGKGGYFDVPLEKPVDIGGVKVWYFHCSFGAKNAFYSRSLAKQLWGTVRDFDIVHVAAFWQFIQVSVSRACRKFNIPYIISVHGCLMKWGLGRKKWKRFPYWYLFTRPTLLKANAVHYVSNGERIESLKRFNQDIPSYIIPNCLVSDNYIVSSEQISDFRKLLKVPEDTFIVSFLSLIRPRKGLELLIRAISKLKDGKLILLIGGTAENQEYLKSLKKMCQNYGIEQKVKWLGLVEPKNLSSFYGVSDIFVLPSFEEAFGMVVIEAMACGTPVLISKGVPIWEEVIADGAGWVIEFSPQDIADKINKLVSNQSLLQSFSKKALQSVRNRYDSNAVACSMKGCYEDVIAYE